jgi:hypothetical protein
LEITVRAEFSITDLGLGGGTTLPDGVEGRDYNFTFSVTTDTISQATDVGQATEAGNGAITNCDIQNLPAGLTFNLDSTAGDGCTVTIQGNITATANTFTGITLTVTDTPILEEGGSTVVPAGQVQEVNIDLTVQAPMTLTMNTAPNVSFVDNAAGTTGLAPDGVIGRTYGAPAAGDLVFTVGGGIPPYSFSVSGGALPDGITCAQPVAGDPTFVCNSNAVALPGTAATSTFTAQATDNSGGANPAVAAGSLSTDAAGHNDHTITVNPALTPTLTQSQAGAPVTDPANLLDGVEGRSYGVVGGTPTYTAAGGLGPGTYSWCVSTGAASLPTGLNTVSTNCAAPTVADSVTLTAATIGAPPGAFPFDLQLDDPGNDAVPPSAAAAASGTSSTSITINSVLVATLTQVQNAVPVANPAALLDGVEGRSYGVVGGTPTYTAAGGLGTGSYNWCVSGGALPPGFAGILIPSP